MSIDSTMPGSIPSRLISCNSPSTGVWQYRQQAKAFTLTPMIANGSSRPRVSSAVAADPA